MRGKWEKVIPVAHEHTVPREIDIYAKNADSGSVYRCDCGERFILERKLDQNFDNYFFWRRLEGS